ncbi:hypothetical protein ACTXG6_22735 [Pseudonocardia sp. Cha107L01]|jgi:hypothetical protein|uniref:hypothetical protein n=1 Tax=Pseudonocardia sp. Cha107L01 TaxID=3457576 RepID=UPI00403E4454
MHGARREGARREPGPGGRPAAVGTAVGTAAGADRDSVTHIAGAAAEFPGWATLRAPWRERDVRIEGDEALGAALLDHMNVV